MSMGSYNQSSRKCEMAFERMILAMAGGTLKTIPIMRRFAGDDITGPALLIVAREAVESYPDAEPTDMWDASMELSIRTHYRAEDGSAFDERHDELVGQVVDLLKQTDICTALNLVMVDEEFTAFEMRRPVKVANAVEARHYVSTVSAVLIMTPYKETTT